MHFLLCFQNVRLCDFVCTYTGEKLNEVQKLLHSELGTADINNL